MHNEFRINYICPECLYCEQLIMQITGKSSPEFNPGITTRATCTRCGTVMLHVDKGLYNAIQKLLEKKYYIYKHCSQNEGVVCSCYECESDFTVSGPFIVFGPVFKKERELFNRIMESPGCWIAHNTLDAMFDENGEHVSVGYTFGDNNTISLLSRIEKDSDRKAQLYEVACAAINDIVKVFTYVIDVNNPKRRPSTSSKDRASIGFRHRYIKSVKYFNSDMMRKYQGE